MRHTDPFDYSRDGELMVGAHERDVVAYDGLTGQPLWLRSSSSQVLFVRVTDDDVVALSSDFVLTTWGLDGDELSRRELGVELDTTQTPHAMDSSDSSASTAFLVPDRTVLVQKSGDVVTADTPGATCLCCVDSGEFVAVGMEDGRVAVLDMTGQWLEDIRIGGAPVADLSYVSAEETWYVLAGSEILRINMLGEPESVTSVAPHRPDALAVSQDANLLALRLDRRHVHIVRQGSGVVADVLYNDREVGQIVFGPGALLGVGLDFADANKINLLTGEVWRTDTHARMEHRSWTLSVDLAADPGEDWAIERVPAFDPAAFSDERRALDAYHLDVSRLEDAALQTALRHGWVPEDLTVLLEAGMRCLPLLEQPSIDEEPAKSAHARLEAIMVRVRCASITPESQRALVEWDRAIATAQKKERNDMILGCAFLIAMAVAAVMAVGWLL